ncbi:Dicer-like protein 1 [Marasmius crinis-equi]|uniref:Dicer-like protein 1 n=1 Tax=Marasmius crinis-equi TaxID=585013 RepID=A0ABR3F687_9AGAR
MLNRWKKRWRGEDSGQLDGTLEHPHGGPENDAFSDEGVEAVPPTGESSTSWGETSSSTYLHKRKITLDQAASERVTKKSRKNDLHSPRDLSTESKTSSDAIRRAQDENSKRHRITASIYHSGPAEELGNVADRGRTLNRAFSGLQTLATNSGRDFVFRESLDGYTVDMLADPRIIFIPLPALFRSLKSKTFSLEGIRSMALICQIIPDTVTKLMRDYYRCLSQEKRPRLLSVVVSAVDVCSRQDFDLLKLEWVLQSAVYGLTDAARWQSLCPPTAAEITVTYDPTAPLNDAPLLARLRSLDPGGNADRRHFITSSYVLEEVGPWAASWLWKNAFRDRKINDLDTTDARRRELWDVVKNWPLESPTADMSAANFDLAPRAVKLVQLLGACEPHEKEFRGVVFVRRRVVALALTALIEAFNRRGNLSFLRPVAMTQSHSSTAIAESATKIARGTCNLAIATRSFEDLELPQASVIIYYDLFDSQITRAHALSRLREKGHLVYMVEKGNAIHRRILARITRPTAQVQRWAAVLRHTPESSVPPNTEDDVESYSSDSEAEDEEKETIRDPLTNNRLTEGNAIVALYRFSSKFFQDTPNYIPLFEFDDVTDYEYESVHPSYRCRVILRGHLMASSWSSPHNSKAGAKRQASYLACHALFNAGVLDHHFFPSDRKYLEDIQINPKTLPPLGEVFPGTRTYPRRSPDFWQIRSPRPNRLFPILIRPLANASLPFHAPLLLLCRHPAPEFPEFNVFFTGISSSIQFIRAQPLCPDNEQLENLLSYSIRVWRYVRNKPYTCSVDQIPYFFAPVAWGSIEFRSSELYNLPDVSNAILWDQVSLAGSSYAVAMKFGSPEDVTPDIVNAVIQDRWTEFTRRYDVERVRPDMTPLSRPPEVFQGMKYGSFLELCKAHRKEFSGLKDENQSLIEVTTFPTFLDRLNPTTAEPYVDRSHRFFIPELCAKCTIPASTMRTALLLPCILQRMEEFLLVKEMNARLFSHTLPDNLLHMALTTRSVEIEYDYERLEILGDSILKLMASLYVFVTNPGQDEGYLHTVRQDIISNKSLFECSLTVGLPVYIHARLFSLKDWPPPNFEIEKAPGANTGARRNGPAVQGPSEAVLTQQVAEGNGSGSGGTVSKRKRKNAKRQQLNDRVHWLSDKAIADVAEAIIGAGYLSGGLKAALRIAKALKLRMPQVEQWSDFGRIANVKFDDPRTKDPNLADIEAIVGHHFERPHLLMRALVRIAVQPVHMEEFADHERSDTHNQSE